MSSRKNPTARNLLLCVRVCVRVRVRAYVCVCVCVLDVMHTVLVHTYLWNERHNTFALVNLYFAVPQAYTHLQNEEVSDTDVHTPCYSSDAWCLQSIEPSDYQPKHARPLWFAHITTQQLPARYTYVGCRKHATLLCLTKIPRTHCAHHWSSSEIITDWDREGRCRGTKEKEKNRHKLKMQSVSTDKHGL